MTVNFKVKKYMTAEIESDIEPTYRDVGFVAWCAGRYDITTHLNEYHGQPDPYGTWDVYIESGRDYLVGKDTPMAWYLKTHTSPLRPWQKLAVLWVWQHPEHKLSIWNGKLSWVFQRRGELVEIGLPHHGEGGERHWGTRPPFTSRVLVNVD